MPPKPKFTRDEIIEAALKIAADRGMKALTSRELGAALGSSARPIFTVFKNMEELHMEVRKAALAKFDEYVEKASGYTPIFKQIGLQMILFAVEQPKLYKLIYMSENPQADSFDDVFASLGNAAVMCVDVIMHDYDMNREDAMILFQETWIYTYGVGSLIAAGMCRFTQDEIQNMLSRQFAATLASIKSGNHKNCFSMPEKKE